MKHLPLHTIDTAPESSRDMLLKTQEAFGFLPNLLAVMSTSPAMTKAYLSLSEIFSSSSLSVVEQQVVLLTVSRFHQCHYCVSAHTTISRMNSVPDNVLESIRQDQPISDDKLDTLRQFTHHLLTNRGWAADDILEKFLAAGYSQQSILDIIVGISLKTLSNYTNHLADTPLDAAFSDDLWQPPV